MSPLEVFVGSAPPTPLAVVRRRATAPELSRVVPECCGLVWNLMRAQGAQAGRNVAVYLNGAIDLEVGVEALGPFTEREGLVRSATPGGLVATVTLLGPYDGLAAAHSAVRDWARAHGHHLLGPNWEIYGHWQEAWNSDPSLIRTNVCYQLASPLGSGA